MRYHSEPVARSSGPAYLEMVLYRRQRGEVLALLAKIPAPHNKTVAAGISRELARQVYKPLTHLNTILMNFLSVTAFWGECVGGSTCTEGSGQDKGLEISVGGVARGGETSGVSQLGLPAQTPPGTHAAARGGEVECTLRGTSSATGAACQVRTQRLARDTFNVLTVRISILDTVNSIILEGNCYLKSD